MKLKEIIPGRKTDIAFLVAMGKDNGSTVLFLYGTHAPPSNVNTTYVEA